MAVGVPEITPVLVLKLKPAGKAGEMLYPAGVPPLLLGVNGVIAVFK
jgi:hypothetical protein